jgi:hypothetical protein
MAERIESWKSNDGVICANEFDAVTQDFREWLTANVRAINQPIVTALISAVTHDITALREFASIVEAISAAHPGQPVDFLTDPADIEARHEAAKHVEPAHDIATLTPEQVLDQKRGYTRGEQPFVDKVQVQPFGLNPGDPLSAHPDYIASNIGSGMLDRGGW